MNNGKFFAGLALGALVGSALSCFAHSNRGRKLRRDIYDTFRTWKKMRMTLHIALSIKQRK